MSLSTRERDQRFATLADHYRPVIKSIISRYLNNVGDYRIDIEELYQEGLIALYHASNTFKGHDGDFEPYAYVVIRRAICRKINATYRMYTHEMISIDRYGYAESSILLYKARDQYSEPASAWHLKEYARGLLDVYEDLDDMQKAICERRRVGKKYAEIASDLGISRKKVDNEIQKIRNKIKFFDIKIR